VAARLNKSHHPERKSPLSESSNYSSIRVTEGLMVAAIDGDEQAQALIESWKPQYQVLVLAADDPLFDRIGEVTFNG
jgi:hypothetical protein